jgi:hypothetical protein
MAPRIRKPAAGRAWFEQTIRDQLTLGRPDRVAVVFGRRVSRQTLGRFHTRVISSGTEPAIQVHYLQGQAVSRGRPRVADRDDRQRHLRLRHRLTAHKRELDALLALGHDINQRLLDAQLQDCACASDAATLPRVVLPSTHDGQPAPGLRFGDPRVMALLASLCTFSHLLEGITNRSLRALVTWLIPGYTPRQMTYDLRRLRRKGFIERVAPHPALHDTADGRRLAVFFTKTYARILCPSLAELPPCLPPRSSAAHTLARAWQDYEHALAARIADAAIRG